MKCPYCSVAFHPQMERTWIGKNAKGMNIYVFYQICPECQESVGGIKEQRKDEWFLSSSDVEGVILLTKEKQKQLGKRDSYNIRMWCYRDSDNLGCFYCGVFGRFAATALFTSNIRSGTTSCQSLD